MITQEQLRDAFYRQLDNRFKYMMKNVVESEQLSDEEKKYQVEFLESMINDYRAKIKADREKSIGEDIEK